MLKISEIFAERKYKKKYNAMKLVYEDSLMERDILRNENEILRGEIKKLIRERNDLDGRNTKKELSNNKRPNATNGNRKTSSKKDNGRSNIRSTNTKDTTTTNKQVNSTNKNN
jgi:hypothetical protein